MTIDIMDIFFGEDWGVERGNSNSKRIFYVIGFKVLLVKDV